MRPGLFLRIFSWRDGFGAWRFSSNRLDGAYRGACRRAGRSNIGHLFSGSRARTSPNSALIDSARCRLPPHEWTGNIRASARRLIVLEHSALNRPRHCERSEAVHRREIGCLPDRARWRNRGLLCVARNDGSNNLSHSRHVKRWKDSGNTIVQWLYAEHAGNIRSDEQVAKLSSGPIRKQLIGMGFGLKPIERKICKTIQETANELD